MLDGFKKFIMRGNVIDLAVGVIIGAAFKPIIDALTDKILLRFISASRASAVTVMWGAGQTRVPLPCRRRLAPTRPSVRFVSAAWLRRAIQRLASSAVRTLGGSRGRAP